MPASYPGAIKTFVARVAGQVARAAHIQDIQDEVTAIETALGTNPAGNDGWAPAGETWTYASANTVTVSGDVRTRYPTGTKVKLTQTSVKYFYAVGSSYSGGITTLTLTGGSDYTVANAAITSPYLSYASAPQGFPQWFNWTPSLNTDNADLSGYDLAQFAITGRICTIEFIANNRNVTGSTGTIKIGLPIATSLTVTNSHQFIAVMFNGSSYVNIRNELVNASAVITLYKEFTATDFSATETGYYFRISGSYPI